MKKRLFLLIMAAVLLLAPAAYSQSEAPGTRVFDDVGLYTQEQLDTLESAIGDFQKQTGYDFSIAIVTEALGYSDYQALSDAIYLNMGLGRGISDAAVLCTLDVYEDGSFYLYVSVYGELKYLTVDEDRQYLRDTIVEYLSDGSFVDGFIWAMNIFTEAEANLALNDSTRVYDFADMLTDEETATLESEIADFRALTDADFLFLSTYGEMEGNEDGEYMYGFYDRYGFGTGATRTGAMVYIDLHEDNHFYYYIKNYGNMDTAVSQDTLNTIMGLIKPLMESGEILDATKLIIQSYEAYLQ